MRRSDRCLLAVCIITMGAASGAGLAADWPTYRADAASHCTCSYLNQATVALCPQEP